MARFTHGQLSESAANTRRFNGRKGGRKTILTRDLAKRICEAIATSPHSLQRTIDLHAEHNGANDWPKHHTTIEEWRNKYPWFAALFTRARAMQAEFIAQTCLDFNPTEKDGERPPEVNVAQVQAVITPAKLEELRAGLEETREALRDKAPANGGSGEP